MKESSKIRRWGSSLMLLFISLVAELPAQDRPYFNDKKVPDSLEDLMAIQKALRDNLARTRAATVSITDGKGFGSGVIVSKDGLVMTAAHVTGGVNREMKIIMEDGTEHNAISLGLDSFTDAALLKITDKGEYPFVTVDKNEMEKMTTRLGDWVYSLGHSGGFDKDRGSVVRIGRIVRIGTAPATFQSDCKLIGGDSGGPLFNMNGELIGIHSRVGKVLDQNMHVASYDFFTKMADGSSKWDAMLDAKFLGSGPFAQKPRPGNAFMGFALKEGGDKLEIYDVDEEAPAGKKGIKKGDMLVSLDGKEMLTKQDMKAFMETKAEGDRVQVKLLRKGEEVEIELILKAR